jgi:hypothetical protein
MVWPFVWDLASGRRSFQILQALAVRGRHFLWSLKSASRFAVVLEIGLLLQDLVAVSEKSRFIYLV